GEENNLIDSKDKKAIITFMKNKLEEWFEKYADPCIEGSSLPVSGNGQIKKVGKKNNNTSAFIQERPLIYDPQYDPGMKNKDED
ncbi:MAG: hypothetical protein ACOCRB_02570, partial [Halanaerobiaceae bacterium]